MLKRQGDLLFVRVKELPKNAKPVENAVLAEGETTGHAHRLQNGKVFAGPDAMSYFVVADGAVATIVHEEHRAIKFEPGVWQVRRQREYAGDLVPRTVAD